ncbi:uncharacterized protein Z519_01045 [Cladophialophora bantiana CBS 173.52]|uniref:Uncharacterized protein n=1 Tax=Cladophialophora bantiana (strain ATCC 10958 / CBS 173.52 / CDC B-1940 / NIH 8579) TaxID=1442370 RepID=A0A0D2F5I5_CLAB1|nr:uncharacterized protein Z519_01045 [Cladophialophora bantiana CBS 173.52]KIW97461.1 hypothetical protein Z519_01045 [Cladophialophora bantiana CBS 173.52]
MAWYSLLPAQLTVYETWIVRAFLILAFINMVPWLLAILYDILYYIGRRIWHEIPVWGGRARGEHRPRAPSLRDRARRVSFRDLMSGGMGMGMGREEQDDQLENEKSKAPKGHRRGLSAQSIEEEKDEEMEDEEDRRT